MTQSRPPRCRRRATCVQRRFDLAELVVDKDANRLEGLGRRVLFLRLCAGTTTIRRCCRQL